MADSIDHTQHVIYDDTVALGGVIRTLDNPLGRLLMSNTLGKAYYYMGRNHHLSNRISEAAECYIEADRLKINDPIYRGRVNSCMGYICSQCNSDSLALAFYKRANICFEESNNEWYYAQSLLNIGYHYIHLHEFILADSILQMAQSYHLDSSYLARHYETRGLYFYELQQYDSALLYFNKALACWQSEQDKLFSYMKIMQIYDNLNNITAAIPYAQFIVDYSNSPNYLINAYYCLIQDAEFNENIELLSTYSHMRADAQSLWRDYVREAAQSIPNLENYLNNPYPWLGSWIIVIVSVLLCSFFIIRLVIYRKNITSRLNNTATHLQIAQEKIINQSTRIQKQENELNYDKCIAKIATKYLTPPNRWNQYHLLKKDTNPYLHEWLNALDKLDLTNREKVFCVFIFIYPHLPISKIAYYMNNTENAVRVLKTRIAQKMGITSAELLNFLKKMFYTN